MADVDDLVAKEPEETSKDRQAKNREILLALVAEGKLPEPRAMTRKERKEFDASGNNPYKPKTKDSRSFLAFADDATDWIFDHMYKDFDADNLPNNVCNIFALYIVGLTYKDELAEKN